MPDVTQVERPAPRFGLSLSVSLKNEPEVHLTYTGDIPMEVLDAYQQVVGNALARVSVGTDLSYKDFGTGTGAMVTVSLACNQDQATIYSALSLASQMGIWFAKNHWPQAEAELAAIKARKDAEKANQLGR